MTNQDLVRFHQDVATVLRYLHGPTAVEWVFQDRYCKAMILREFAWGAHAGYVARCCRDVFSTRNDLQAAEAKLARKA